MQNSRNRKKFRPKVFFKKKNFFKNKSGKSKDIRDENNIFLKRYSKLGQEIDVKSIELKKTIRVNSLKIDSDELVNRLEKKRVKLEKIDFLDFGYSYRSYFSLGSTPEYLMGYYFLQKTASQIPVQVLDAVPGEVILDMCAAPGGKTSQIAQYMNNKGVVVAIDNRSRRVDALKNNLQRMGVNNCIVYKMDALDVAKLGIKFDKIILDAPCSGNFVTDEDWFNKRDIEGVQKNAKNQREMLKAAFSVLKKDGVLVYSTCSLEPEENEMNINWLMDNFKTKIEDIDVNIGSKGLTKVFNNKLRKELSKTRRFWPNLTGTQGFYVAKIRKR